MGGYQEKYSKQGYLWKLKSCLSPLISSQRFGDPPLPDIKRETPLQIENFLTYINVSYKRLISNSVFRTSLISAIKKNNNNSLRTSLTVLWLRHCTFTVGGLD